MKKTLLFASALSLALLAGCTKDEPQNTPQGGEAPFSIIGSIATPETKLQIGEINGDKAPLLWENGDELILAAANADNIIPKYYTVMSPTFQSFRFGGTGTAETTTPSRTTSFTCPITATNDVIDGTYTLWGISGQDVRYSHSQEADLTNFFTLPDFSYQSYGTTNPYFLVGSAPIEANAESVNLTFTNTTAVMMLNLTGTAKISKIEITLLDGDGNKTIPLAYVPTQLPVKVDMTKAPVAGTTAANFTNFIVASSLETAEKCSTITVDMGATGLQLTEESVSIPVGVLPFEISENNSLIVTTYGTDRTQSVTDVFTGKAGSIVSNSIVYLTIQDIPAESLGQTPAKDDWAAGDVVFEDDFSWVKTAATWEDYDPEMSGGGFGQPLLNLGGWTDIYSNNGMPYNNYLAAMENATSMLTEHGYVAMGYAYALWYENNGMLSTSATGLGTTTLGYSLSALNNYKGNITLSFKACRITEATGNSDMSMPAQFPISINGSGTINGATSVTIGSEEYAPFTFYEYTLVIENADATTQITFGSQNAGMYLDDIKIVISDTDDTNNLSGTEVQKQAATLAYSLPANDETISLPATGAKVQTVVFKVTGPWKAKYTDNMGTTSSEIDGTTKWLQLGYAQWGSMTTFEDTYGNLNPTAMQIKNIKDNTTGAERTATLEIVSPDEATTYATFNFKQAAQ